MGAGEGWALLAALPGGERALLARCAAVATGLGARPYLVGGAVRDLLLGWPTHDLDLVVVGDAPATARAAHERFGGALTVHEAFGTATLALPDGRAIDLITARRERYPAPGALPVIAPGDLDDDLRRRDFTINALALSLAPDDEGTVHDPLGGRGDLAAGVVRILHDASFRDDPTRLLRAVRYGARLAAATGRPFARDPRTAARFAEAVADGALGTVSVQRAAHEFARLLAEPAAAAMVAELAASGLLPQLEPRLRWDGEASAAACAALDRRWHLAEDADGRWRGRFALLAAWQGPEAAAATAAALHFPAAVAALARGAAEARQIGAELPPDPTNAELGRRLDPFAPAALVVAAALLPPAQGERLIRYLAEVRPVVPALTGVDIRALGVPPGPIYRAALAALRDHKRDHPTLTPDDERGYLAAWLRGRGALPGS